MIYKSGSPFRSRKTGYYYRLYNGFMRDMKGGCDISHKCKVTQEGIELTPEMEEEFEYRPDAEVFIRDHPHLFSP